MVGGHPAGTWRDDDLMKISYTGRQVELVPAQQKKLEAQFAKIAKLLDGRHECEAHVTLSTVRHLHRAEAVINYYGQQLAGQGSDGDLFTAIHEAAGKLEKQVAKARAKWRETRRSPRNERPAAAAELSARPVPEPREEAPAVRIYHMDHHEKRKPMTLDEAILAMDGAKDYMAYRDAETNRISVLLRRRDGHFDLVEG
jgi:putative sigma-54 modulation protein